jgi:hypothetical protein
MPDPALPPPIQGSSSPSLASACCHDHLNVAIVSYHTRRYNVPQDATTSSPRIEDIP